MSAIARLTPQMTAYADEFADTGRINWQPYLMYFHPASYMSPTVGTDIYGFRYSEARGRKYAVADLSEFKSVRLIAGSSTVFGIGATADRHTLASRMTQNDPRPEPWVNFGGRSFNSTQELILFALHRHLLPDVKEIVIFSGFNNLGLSRLPPRVRNMHGAFFNCEDFYAALKKPSSDAAGSWFGRAAKPERDQVPALAEQIRSGAELTLRHLEIWRILAAALGAKLTFALQPLANWVRAKGTPEEEEIFAELERKGRFSETYGDILTQDSFHMYAEHLRRGTELMNVTFINMVPRIAEAVPADEWLFVDRIHFTDGGNDLVSKLLLRELA
jgi:hypothetical protein